MQRFWTPQTVVVLALASHTILLAWSAARHSPVWHEPAHLHAGMRVWSQGDFSPYRVNPPLVAKHVRW